MGIKQCGHRKGFTFIEMLIVIGIISLAVPTLYAIFFIILQEQVKVTRLNQVKKEGTFVADVMTMLVRNNASGIYSAKDPTKGVCSYNAAQQSYSGAPSNPFWFRDKYDNWFTFTLSSGAIASQSSIPNATINLNSAKVLISNFSSRCATTSYASPLAIFSYDICFNINGACGSGNNLVSFHFQPTIKLRNY